MLELWEELWKQEKSFKMLQMNEWISNRCRNLFFSAETNTDCINSHYKFEIKITESNDEPFPKWHGEGMAQLKGCCFIHSSICWRSHWKCLFSKSTKFVKITQLACFYSSAEIYFISYSLYYHYLALLLFFDFVTSLDLGFGFCLALIRLRVFKCFY